MSNKFVGKNRLNNPNSTEYLTWLTKMAKNSMDESDDDWEELVSYSSYITTISKVVINECLENNAHDDCNIIPNDHRSRQRSKRTCFDHDQAKECIYRDYLGSDALFIGKNFEMKLSI